MLKKRPERIVRYVFLALCIVLGFLQAWANRTTIVNDTVSYLDIGDFIWRGQWALAVNGLWNPLFSAILGITLGSLRPSFHWEYPLVHLVLFLIYLATLWSFDFFLRQLIALRRDNESHEEFRVPAWVWFCIGYILFLWASLRLIGVSETNPDMLVAAFFYLACGLLVKIRRGTGRWGTYCGLGLVLGLGYLTKSIMFPVSVICLGVAFIIARPQWRRVLVSVAIFLVVAGPYILALSKMKGRVTFGDSGLYNYAVHVNKIPAAHWQGEQGESGDAGLPLHPTRKIFSQPAIFEFKSPIDGTYPAWTDPTYWYEGVRAPFNLRRAVARELYLLQLESVFLFEIHGALIASVFIVLFMSGRRWLLLRDLSRYWFLLVPSFATLALYASIHIEPRYLAPFLRVFLLTLLIGPRLPVGSESGRLYSAIAALLIVMYFVPIGSPSLNLTGFVRDIRGRSTGDPDAPERVVEGMYQLGLRPGDWIASLQWSLYGMSTWARLARVKIIAEAWYAPQRPETFMAISGKRIQSHGRN